MIVCVVGEVVMVCDCLGLLATLVCVSLRRFCALHLFLVNVVGLLI